MCTFDEVNKKQRYREYEQLPKVKTIIENNYKKFPYTAYANFNIILNELMKIQIEFHNPKPIAKAKKKIATKK